MDRLEQLVVHIEEALRLARAQDVARLRLALLLLDSAAELMLHRAVVRERQMEPIERNLLEIYDRMLGAGQELPAEDLQRKRDLEERLPTLSQAKKIDKYFDEKAKFLRRRGLLDPAQVRVLQKLHEYRNEAQHNDALRPGSVQTAVRIYAYLVCTMLRDLPTQGVMIAFRSPDPLAAYMAGYRGNPFDMNRHIAAILLARAEVADAESLGADLAEHLTDRLDGLDDGLAEAAKELGATADDPWDPAAILSLVQVKDDARYVLSPPSELRNVPISLTASGLRRLRLRAEALQRVSDPIAAFNEFADVEDLFEPVEAELHSLLAYIDREVQREIDRIRGK